MGRINPRPCQNHIPYGEKVYMKQMSSGRSLRHSYAADSNPPARAGRSFRRSIAVLGITASLAGLGLPSAAHAALIGGDIDILTDTSTNAVLIGNSVDGNGHLNVQDGALLSVTGDGASAGTISGTIYDEGELALGFNGGRTGTAAVTGANTRVISHSLYVGKSGIGSLTIENRGHVTSHISYLGLSSGSSGSITITGQGSVLETTGPVVAGFLGSATIRVEDGGTFSSQGGVNVGESSNASATVTGQGSSWTNTSTTHIGNFGNGTFNIEDGATVTTRHTYVGRFNGGKGTVNVTGAGSTWQNSGLLNIGQDGQGTVNILDQAYVRVQDTTKLYTSDDTLEINGGTLHTTSLDALSGNVNLRNGTLHIDGGTYTRTAGTSLIVSGNDITDNPLFKLSNGATTQGVSFVYLGLNDSRQGQIVVESGSTLSSNYSYLGFATGSVGTATITGAGSQWNDDGVIRVGVSGRGTLDILDGATVTSSGGMIGHANGSQGDVTVSGANSQWLVEGNLHLGSGQATLLVDNGGKVTSGKGDVAGSGLSNGSVTVTGEDSIWHNSGIITVGSSNAQATGRGSLVVSNGGTVIAEQGLIIQEAGSLSGNGGTIVGEVINYGLLSPGSSPGSLFIEAALTLMDTSTFVLDIAGQNAGVDYDQIFVNGDFTIDGKVILDFTGFTLPTYDTTYDLVRAMGWIDGDWSNFSSIEFINTFDGFDPSMLGFVVDRPDDGLQALRLTIRGLGELAPLPTTAVPEPASALLISLGGLAILTRRRRD